MAMGYGSVNPLQRRDAQGRLISVDGGQTTFNPQSGMPSGAPAPSAPAAPPIIQGGPDPNLHPLGPVGGPQATPPSTAVTGAMNSGLDAILKQINSAFDANKGAQNAEAQRLMANRGLGRTDGAGQAINADVMGRFEAQRSKAVMEAMLADQNNQEQKRQFDAQLALHQQQAQMAQQQAQANLAWQQQQQNWQREDRTREQALLPQQQQLEQQRLQLQQQQLGQQLSAGNRPTMTAPNAGPVAAPAGGVGVSNGGESFAETMARFGYGGASPAASAVGGAMTGGGGPPLGAGSGPGDTLNAGSSAGLNADGSWKHPTQYNPNGSIRSPFGGSGSSTVGTTNGPSSVGGGGGGGVPGLNTQPGMRTNPNSLSR